MADEQSKSNEASGVGSLMTKWASLKETFGQSLVPLWIRVETKTRGSGK